MSWCGVPAYLAWALVWHGPAVHPSDVTDREWSASCYARHLECVEAARGANMAFHIAGVPIDRYWAVCVKSEPAP